MEPEVAPRVPDFVPAELEARYGADARRTVRRSTRRPISRDAFEIWFACLTALSAAATLLAAGIGVLYLTMVAEAMALILGGIVGGLVIAWLPYLLARRFYPPGRPTARGRRY